MQCLFYKQGRAESMGCPSNQAMKHLRPEDMDRDVPALNDQKIWTVTSRMKRPEHLEPDEEPDAKKGNRQAATGGRDSGHSNIFHVKCKNIPTSLM